MLTPLHPRRNRPSKVMICSAILFLLFDSAVLGLGYWTARLIAADAVTINLAGRQRMLSQRMVKALLLVGNGLVGQRDTDAARTELANSVALFDSTLHAFAYGGEAVGGEGLPVSQAASDDSEGQALLQQSLQLWQPYHALLLNVVETPDPGSELMQRATQMASHRNLPLLSLANQFTSHVERQSTRRTERLRTLQVSAFVLALINFGALLFSMMRQMQGLYRHSEHLHKAARLDPLTHLPNRIELLERLQQAMERLQVTQGQMVVGFLDLNKFKPVNDRYGHDVGDELLRKLAMRLLHCVRHTDTVARIGGDEFVILLDGIEDIQNAAQLLEKLTSSIARPANLSGIEVCVGSSIGALLVSEAIDAERLLQLADKLMYEVKRDTSRCWQLARVEMPGFSLRLLIDSR